MASAASDALSLFWKSIFFYILLVVLLRVMGKREVGSLTPIDIVVVLMISEAAIIPIEDKAVPLLVGVVPVLTLAALEVLSSWASLKSQRVRTWITGRPSVLIERGNVNLQQMAGARFTMDDLLAQLRQNSISDVADVEYAVLETTGRLSVIPRGRAAAATADQLAQQTGRVLRHADHADQPARAVLPLTLIVDGEIDRTALRDSGHDEAWLRQRIRSRGWDGPQEVLLATFDPSKDRLRLQRRDRRPGEPARDGGAANG